MTRAGGEEVMLWEKKRTFLCLPWLSDEQGTRSTLERSMAKFRKCFKQHENLAGGRISQPVSLKTEFSSLKCLKSDFKNTLKLGGKWGSRYGTALNLERRKLGTFALLFSFYSVIEQDNRLVWKKQPKCPLFFLWELDIPLITLHLAYLWEKV